MRSEQHEVEQDWSSARRSPPPIMYIPSPLYNNINDKTQASSPVVIQHTGRIYDNGRCKGEGNHTSHSYPRYPGIFRFPHQLRKIDNRSNLTDRIPGFSGQLCHHEHSTTSGEDPEVIKEAESLLQCQETTMRQLARMVGILRS